MLVYLNVYLFFASNSCSFCPTIPLIQLANIVFFSTNQTISLKNGVEECQKTFRYAFKHPMGTTNTALIKELSTILYEPIKQVFRAYLGTWLNFDEQPPPPGSD